MAPAPSKKSRVPGCLGALDAAGVETPDAAELAERVLELQAANEELAQFAHAASHDLREPLRMVISYVELLNEDYRDKLDDQARLYIDFAVDGAKRMRLLIDDVLHYSQVGSSAEERIVVDSQALAQDAVDDLRDDIDGTKGEVSIGALPSVRACPSQMKQLFHALLSNAIKFRRQDAAPRVDVSATVDGDEHVFRVTDNGIGFDMQYAERVFGAFQRLHARSEYDGAGLGLALCKKIIERHDGRIWVESMPGTGSCFLFSLPVGEIG